MTPLLCKDCRHVNRSGGPPAEWRCVHPASRWVPPIDLVTGKTFAAVTLSCAQARVLTPNDFCGPRGRFWEALA